MSDQINPPGDGPGVHQPQRQHGAVLGAELGAIFRDSPIGFAFLDGELRYTVVNAAAARLSGSSATTPEALLGRTIGSVLNDQIGAAEAAESVAMFRDVLQTGTPQAGRSQRMLGPGGAVFYVDWQVRRVGDGGGAGILITISDVTEHETARRALQESEQRYKSLFDRNPDPVFSLDAAGRFVAANPACERVSGYALAEILGRPFTELCAPDRLGPTLANFARTLSGQPENLVTALVRKDGRQVELLVTGGAVVVDGAVVGVQCAAKDVTEREQVQRRLRSIMTRARCILWHAEIEGLGSWEQDAGGLGNRFFWRIDIEDANAAQQVLPLEVPPGQTYADAWLRSKHAEDTPAMHGRSAGAMIRGEAGYSQEFRCTDREGSVRWLAEDVSLERVGREARWRAIGVVTDITERKRAEAESRRARDAAEAANRAKDHFLAVLSHELRTPLGGILLWTHLLRRGAIRADELPGAFETIEHLARDQAQLVDDLLDVSRIVHGKLKVDALPTDLAAVVRAATGAFGPMVRDKEIELSLAVETPAAIVVVGDAGRLRQVVGNLLGNAIRFTPTDGHVRVSLGVEGGRAELAVSDTGRGIPADFLPHVFDRFAQAGAAKPSERGGLGLGLAIVRYLVEAHGGSVAAASDGPGRGSRFTVSLPLAPAGAAALFDRAAAARSANPAPPGGSQTLAGVRVLVVDDEEDLRELLARLFQASGAEVHAAASAAEALEEVTHWEPHVLVSDIAMPETDGYVLIDRVRELDGRRGTRTPAVAVTAMAGGEHWLEALGRGFDVHVAKPMDPDALVRIVGELARRG